MFLMRGHFQINILPIGLTQTGDKSLHYKLIDLAKTDVFQKQSGL